MAAEEFKEEDVDDVGFDVGNEKMEGAIEQAPIPQGEESPRRDRSLRVYLFMALALVIAAVAVILVVVFVVDGSGDDGSSGSGSSSPDGDFPPARLISNPQTKLDMVREAVQNNPATTSYANVIPADVQSLEGKFSDETEDPVVRAASWLVHQDTFNEEPQIVARFALASLWYTTKGEEWIMTTDWMSNKSVCDGWWGVTCCGDFYSNTSVRCAGERPDTLTELDLHRNNLRGPIPDTIALLSGAHSLLLENNLLTGELKGSVLGTMPKLRMLYVQHNRLSGPIDPALRDSKVLDTLYIQGNDFTGEWPAAFCKECGANGQCIPPFISFGLDCNKNFCPSECCQKHGSLAHCFEGFE